MSCEVGADGILILPPESKAAEVAPMLLMMVMEASPAEELDKWKAIATLAGLFRDTELSQKLASIKVCRA